LGKSPVIVEGDMVLAESGAIIETLADRYGGASSRRRPVRRSACAICTGCTSPKARRSRRCC
jgi:glutathione S-transferase